MSDLLLKQTLKSGTTRTWKLKPSQKSYSFGSSRHADLVSLSPSSEGIEAVLEFRENIWHLINLSENLNQDSHIKDLSLDKEGNVDFKDFQLHFTPSKKEKDLLEKILSHSLPPEERQNSEPYQLFLTRLGDKILEVKILNPKKKYKDIMPTITEDWIKHPHGEYELWEKTVYLKDNDELLQFKNQEIIDEEMKKPLLAIVSISFIFLLLFIFIPKSNGPQVQPITQNKTAQRIIVKIDKKAPQPKAPKTPPVSAPPAPSQAAPAGDPSKAKSVVSALSIGRVSQLIGKVSNRAAKSSVLLVGKGQAAGTVETGHALAAIGKLNKKGSDWGSQTQGSQIQVSTGGKGGGKSTSGLGSLSAGSTGQANVGLIEDETEVDGGLDKEVIAQYIKSQLGQILYCYERQLSANPNLYGKVSVKFTIGPTGGVEAQNVSDTTLKSASVESCILSKISAWKFPQPQGGTRVVVTYPFLFKSTN